MPVSRDILATWARPRAVMRRLLAAGQREDRALVFLMAACLLIFVAQLPRLQREAFFDTGGAPFEARASITFFAMMVGWPFLAYGLAALSHLLARAMGGQGTWFSARLALFWTLLAVTPAWLFQGLVAGFIGDGPALVLANLALAAAFLAIWALTLSEAERAPEAGDAP